MAKHSEYTYILSKFERIKKSDTEPYSTMVLGKKVPVLPNVHSPQHFSDVAWFADHVPAIIGTRSFFEIGTGTGVIALFVALGGAHEIVTTDINPAAVKNAQRTFRLHNLDIPVRVGDMFKPIKPHEKFDTIFWNHPFFYSQTKHKDMLLRGAFDYKYKSIQAFFQGAKRYLTPHGEVLLGTGTAARISEIKRIAQENGYSCRLTKKGIVQSKHRKGVTMDARIYSFRPQTSSVYKMEERRRS